MVITNGPITKSGVLQGITLFFWKFCFRLRTSYKEFIWCTNYPNIHNRTFCKRWSFIWRCFFPASILNKNKWNFPRFLSFRFSPIPKIENSEISESFLLLQYLVIWNPRSRNKKKKTFEKVNYNFKIWFNKKKWKYTRFTSFRICPIPEIESFGTLKRFYLLQMLIVSIVLSVGKLKVFIEFQMNRSHVY